MNTWIFDLGQVADPLHRAGVHGLWRHLQYGTQRPRDTCTWRLTDTSITLEWADVDDLNWLMSEMVGDLTPGFCVPPGYPKDVNDPTIYATILAHKGITQHFFAKRGAARSRSTGEAASVESAEAPWSTEEKPARLKLCYTQHKPHTEPPYLDKKTKKGVEILDPVQGLGTVYHPMVAQWNMKDQVCSPEVKFILAFSCLAHAFMIDASSGETCGLAVDLPTFSEADIRHRMWQQDCVFRASSPEVARWALSAALDLPPATYVFVSPLGSTFVSITKEEATRFYPILREGMRLRDGLKAIRCLEHIEVLPENSERDAFTYILRNVKQQRAWYTDVLPVDSYPRTRDLFTRMFTKEANAMEEQIARKMSRIRFILSQKYMERYGCDKKKAFERADSMIINVNLNRARNRSALLESLANITREAETGFNGEEMDWILETTKTRCGEVRSLLILACSTFYFKAPEAKPDVKPETDLNQFDS